MKRCEKCEMNVSGSDVKCPLCQNRLTGENDLPAFPGIPTAMREFRLMFRILLAATVSGGVICGAINLILPESGHWSWFVILGVGCFWLSLSLILRKRRNLLKTITYQVVILSLLAPAWDFVTGWRGWSVDFFIPNAFSIALLLMAVLAKVRNIPAGEYIVYLTTTVLFTAAPLIFYLTGLLSVAIPSIICMAFSLITLVGLIVLEGRNMRQEIGRRLHL